MIEEYIAFVESLFPSIDPYIAKKVKESISQFALENKTFPCFRPSPLPDLSQGDIIDNLIFIYFDRVGDEKIRKTKALLLTNTCNAERRRFISFAPLLPLEGYKLDESQIKKNLNYSLLYFPNSSFSEYVVDLNMVSSISRELVENGLKDNSFKKLASLNKFGYYLFLNKLTVHFMRPEDKGVQEERIL